jgi:hypothetical protein
MLKTATPIRSWIRSSSSDRPTTGPEGIWTSCTRTVPAWRSIASRNETTWGRNISDAMRSPPIRLFDTTESAPALSIRERDSSAMTRDTIRMARLSSRAVRITNRLSLSDGITVMSPRASGTRASRSTSDSVASPMT